MVYSDGQNPTTAETWLAVFKDKRLREVKIGPVGLQLLTGMYHAIAAFAATGNHVIVDDVIFDQRVLKATMMAFIALEVLFVGVHCLLEVAERREHARGNRPKGGARTFYRSVHAHKIYDLEIDSSAATPTECAWHIKKALQDKVPRTAFRQLAEKFGDVGKRI
jgi:chloramphenicol 3-O phosphotransferase